MPTVPDALPCPAAPRRARPALCLLGLVAALCGCDEGTSPGAASRERPRPDAASGADAAAGADAGPDGGGARPADLGALDADPRDADHLDAGDPDARVPDAGPPDAEPLYPPPPPYAEARAAQPRTPPPVPAYSRGACPTLAAGNSAEDGLNPAFLSGVDTRQFRLIVPTDYDPARSYPLVFAWHWLAGDSRQMVREGRLDTAADQVGFITVVFDRLLTESGGSAYLFSWPFAEPWGHEQEMTFFDDVFACVHAQLNVDLERVYGVGVSAGALWLTHLMNTPRIDHFAAVEILSGGLAERGEALVMRHVPRAHRFPVFLLWGGPTDRFVINFEDASLKLKEALLAHHHFIVSCTHDAGHGLPPVTTVEGEPRFRMLWRFLLDHPYGLDPLDSPYHQTGLPEEFESWCAIASPPPPAP